MATREPASARSSIGRGGGGTSHQQGQGGYAAGASGSGSNSSVIGGGGAPRSHAGNYASTVATQSDVAKYRGKYKELKSKVREIELENDQIHMRTLDVKRTIQRMRLERALLYERLEEAEHFADSSNLVRDDEQYHDAADETGANTEYGYDDTDADGNASVLDRSAAHAGEDEEQMDVDARENGEGEDGDERDTSARSAAAAPRASARGGRTSSGNGMRVTLRRSGTGAGGA